MGYVELPTEVTICVYVYFEIATEELTDFKRICGIIIKIIVQNVKYFFGNHCSIYSEKYLFREIFKS